MRSRMFLIILIVITAAFTACSSIASPQQAVTEEKAAKEAQSDRIRVSTSLDREKEIWCTKDRKLILVFDDEERVIYDNYNVMTNNPYSVWDFDEYKLQWSADSNYIYIIDSIYDVKNDKLLPIKDCVIFSWIGNKGVYLAEGSYYEISYDGGLQSQMAVGKKLKAVEEGIIKDLEEQQGGRYYVLADSISPNKPFTTVGDYLSIDTATLKYSEGQLQAKIEEELHSESFREMLKNLSHKELNKDTADIMNKIKEIKELQEFQQKIRSYEEKYPIEFYGGVKELERVINEELYGSYNLSGKYFLKDIRKEEVQF